MTNDMIALASNWEDRLRPPKCDKKEDSQVWATSFPHLLTLTQKEKKLSPKAMITYKRPTTIGQKLTNYKDLALNKTRKQTKGGSRPCEHCALCGCYGKNNKSMVPNVSQLLTKTKTFKLNQSLTCADFGIYVTTCVICHEQYVGETGNKFSKRWSAHRSNWNKQYCKTDSDKDQMAFASPGKIYLSGFCYKLSVLSRNEVKSLPQLSQWNTSFGLSQFFLPYP